MRRTLLVSLIAVPLALGGCCGSFRSFVYSPFGPGTLCDSSGCSQCGQREDADDCGGGCGLGCGLAGRRQVVESDCGETCEVGRGGPYCDRYGYPAGPLTWVFEILNPRCWDGGCGERYWGDFHGDPPDCVDPCDSMGHYTGSGGCGCQSSAVGSSPVVESEGTIISETEGVATPTRAAPAPRSPRPEPLEDPQALRRVPTRARR